MPYRVIAIGRDAGETVSCGRSWWPWRERSRALATGGCTYC
jgi:hypothetical protein